MKQKRKFQYILETFSKNLNNFMKWRRLKGEGEATRKLLLTFWNKLNIYRLDTVDVFRYRNPNYKLKLPQGFSLRLRDIRTGEEVIIPDEIQIAPEVKKIRYEQGARCYGAFWDGRLADFTWSISGTDFYDLSDRLLIHLNPGECYNFDYRGIRRHRPMAFSRFVLMKALVLYSINREEDRAGQPLVFYSIVDSDNHPSQVFHFRYLKAEKISTMRLRIIFGVPRWKIPEELVHLFSPGRNI